MTTLGLPTSWYLGEGPDGPLCEHGIEGYFAAPCSFLREEGALDTPRINGVIHGSSSVLGMACYTTSRPTRGLREAVL